MTTLVEQVAIDAQAVTDAQNALAASQAALAAVAPQQSVLERMEAHASVLSIECGDTLRGLVAELRGLIGL